MSHPNTNPIPNKRSSSCSPITTSTTATSGAQPPSPLYFPQAMKKAKTQAVACSLDTNKNGGQHHVHFSSDLAASDPSLAANIEDPNLAADVPTSAATSGGVTANLSRKKATPPQPAKKLVIKLLKGSIFLAPRTSFNCLILLYHGLKFCFKMIYIFC